MGGNLFHLPRMPRAEYVERERAVRAYLDARIPGAYRIPRYYGDKPDFGDMDVLVASRPDWGELRAAIARDLGDTETKATGRVYSMSYRGLQTDLFAVPARYLDSTASFMSFNDVGNFIGRICRRFDLKYGEQGLSYVYRRASGAYTADLEITQDLARICGFLGLDHARWVSGFPTLPDVFDWVIESRYFSVAPYLDERVGSMKDRAKVRPTVQRFLAYLQERGVTQRVDLGDRRANLPIVLAAFPDVDLAGRIEAERVAEARSVAIAEKFSGQRVMRLVPGLTGEALGALIVRLKASVDDFSMWVEVTPQHEIDARIVALAGGSGAS
jgi:hypothetical protein